MTIDNDTILSIFAIILLIGVSIMLGCQYMNKKKKNHNNKKMKWTCGVEGGCEMTMHGSYNSKKECEQKCGGDEYDNEYDEEENYKSLKEQMEEVHKDKEDLKNRMEEHKRQMELESKSF